MPVLVLAGDEDFLLDRRVNELKAELVDPNWSSFNFQRIASPDLSESCDAAATLPFGPGNRMVLLDRCDLFTKKKGKAADVDKISDKALKALLAGFDEALSAVAPQTHLVFACPYNFDSTLRAAKIVEKHAKIETFSKERFSPGSANPKLETWCRKEAHRFAATVDDNAISYLLDSTEADLRQVSVELEKASVYILPGKHITLETITLLSAYHSHVFLLLDAWAFGKQKEALQSLTELLSRTSGIPIIAAISTTLSKWLNLKAAADRAISALPTGPGLSRRALPPAELARKIAGELGLKPYAVEMDLKRAGRFTTAKLADIRSRLCQLEYSVKTGQLSDVQALTIFITS